MFQLVIHPGIKTVTALSVQSHRPLAITTLTHPQGFQRINTWRQEKHSKRDQPPHNERHTLPSPLYQTLFHQSRSGLAKFQINSADLWQVMDSVAMTAAFNNIQVSLDLTGFTANQSNSAPS